MVPSQRVLAEKLGVSQMTVSRALRGENGISEATRQQVLEAARTAGLPLPPSKTLRESAELLHVLCTITAEPSTDSSFHGLLLEGLRLGAKECASEIVNCPDDHAAWPLVVTRKQVDAVVVVWGDEHNPMPHAACPVPSVFVFHGPPEADVVNADNFGGGYALGEHLAGLGHRHVAFLGPDSRMAVERFMGLQAGLGLEGGKADAPVICFRRHSAGSEPAAVDGLLEGPRGSLRLRDGVTAVMAYNDLFAAQAIARLQALGLRVPEDVSIVGFDGIAPASYRGPQITTCAIPLRDLGAEAARLAYWRLEHPNAVRRKLLLRPQLVAGETVRQTF